MTIAIVLGLARTASATLAEDIEEIHRLDRARAAEQDRQRAGALFVRSARLKEAAIEHAIAEYGIHAAGATTGVHYTPHGNMAEREGATVVDRDGTLRVQIGDAAFRSAGWLASSIAHEVEVHVDRQVARGVRRSASDEQGVLIGEVEAYDFELASRGRFGLSDDEARIVRARRSACYRALQYENRQRVDEGNYVKW